ncbi:class I SAM-dependent methyltransferase [Coleofasciculus sp. F4-SAH-05]|uniref:class I SAM-dependent methyltransferase n=1 Tax=Coleofasciculus sp. F4-SAH-05 TaxID=3069525 RepID=UPI0032F2E205
MEDKNPESLDKIRQQFDTAPYPRNPIEQSPQDEPNFLFIHNLVTPYYLTNRKIPEIEGKVILDAGCGTGYATLALAMANPGAMIVGTDISDISLTTARKRLEYHGYKNVNFYTSSIEDLPQLGLEFDYINCDEVLYLLPDPISGLKAMKSVLKPEGIIRTNLHSLLYRHSFYQAQEVFQIMGIRDEQPQSFAIELVRETMRALNDYAYIKAKTWSGDCETEEEPILLNYLLQGDKGYTIPELFSSLKEADLEFVSMVQWQQWQLLNVFQDAKQLPSFWKQRFPHLSIPDKLHFVELINPMHRLLDFWCVHLGQAKPFVPVDQWDLSHWENASVHLHPQLRVPMVRENLINCITNQKPFEVSRYLTAPTQIPVTIESDMASCLLSLWKGVQPMKLLVEHWLKIRPLDPVTLETVSEHTAFSQIKQLLIHLEKFLYVLLERESTEN